MSGATSRVAGAPAAPAVTFAEAFGTWLKIGVVSFGGPAGQIALMHRMLVEEKRWLDEGRYLNALNFCMLLPGPEAQQLATYVGWLLHGLKGALAAGILFVAPGALFMLALSILYAEFANLPLVEAAFLGIKAAVFAIVIEALIRIGRRVLKNAAMAAIAAAAFVAIFLLQLPFPLIVLGAGLIGFLGGRIAPESFAVLRSQGAPATAAAGSAPSGIGRFVRVVSICLVLWFAPIVALGMTLGWNHILVQEGWFFSKLAIVTFGGAYAVLAYMAQAVVEAYGWITPAEMLDGLGLAETTPGPLILVTQFVGFLAAHHAPAPFGPVLAGVIGALLTTWVTFVPCFLWILAGAPYIEGLRARPALQSALSAITAAVVGVILNLTLWFGLRVLFHTFVPLAWGPFRLDWPVLGSIDWPAAVLSAVAIVALFRLGWGVFATLALCAVLSLGWFIVAG